MPSLPQFLLQRTVSNLHEYPQASVLLSLNIVISAALSYHHGCFRPALSLACRHQELHIVAHLVSLSSQSKEDGWADLSSSYSSLPLVFPKLPIALVLYTES